ncbi:hypothetical protein [Petropleomorpha daqingensis]|uniref:Uncharacterized protein n=1 Tax=Petropleomorpha daqingensis TaxID=2026353 RepID=A0A853CKE9_9ACTN|nr:hypothetical protein [Petropleomorpha daqingensis]NYJ07651.1 hypothetical protein [Petropleomorpha daqingensis]
MTTGADWAEQARRLLEAVKAAAAPDSSGDDTGEHPAGECKWCPHCQLLAVLRGDRPEVTAVLDDVLATASAALRSLSGQPTPEPAEHADEPSHRDPAPTVQRIDIA